MATLTVAISIPDEQVGSLTAASFQAQAEALRQDVVRALGNEAGSSDSIVSTVTFA